MLLSIRVLLFFSFLFFFYATIEIKKKMAVKYDSNQFDNLK